MKQLRIAALAAGGMLGLALTAVPFVMAGEVSKRIEIVRASRGSHLGVRLDNAQGAERGAVVREIVKDSPAEKAGLKQGDVIVRFDGEPVRSASQLARLVAETPPGRAVPVEVRRDGATQTLEATLSEKDRDGLLGHLGLDDDLLAMEPPEPPEPPEAPRAPRAPKAPRPPKFDFRWNEDDLPSSFFFRGGPRKLGIEYQPIEGQLAKYFKAPGDQGLLVTSVDEGGPSGKAGLQAGDVILKVGETSIKAAADLRRALAAAEPGTEVPVQVLRGGRTLDLKVTLGGRKDAAPPEETT
jgi:serine protease Do